MDDYNDNTSFLNDFLLVGQTFDGFDVIRVVDGSILVIPSDDTSYTTAVVTASNISTTDTPYIAQWILDDLEEQQEIERSEWYDGTNGWRF